MPFPSLNIQYFESPFQRKAICSRATSFRMLNRTEAKAMFYLEVLYHARLTKKDVTLKKQVRSLI